MSKTNLNYYATDKEIFDILMSSKLKLSETTLLNIAKDRGILYSNHNDRDSLSNIISLLPHDFNDLNSILDKSESGNRSEKSTSVIFNPISLSDIKEVSNNYRDDESTEEKIIITQQDNEISVKIEYTEIDYTKTRLIQRRTKEAEIKFIKKDDKIIARLPANDRARKILADLQNKIEEKLKTQITKEIISLENINDPVLRTKFFTQLISSIDDFKLETVTSLKIESNQFDETPELEDDQDIEEAKSQMLSAVKNVLLKGNNLLSTPEYQQLRSKGFYISSIIWRSKQSSDPYAIYEFEAGFDDPFKCKNFKYNIRGIFTLNKHEYVKRIKSVSQAEQQLLLSIIEESASRNFQTICKEHENPEGT
ncbi:hypothetical protein EHR01_10615 [Leptospira mtsangambouensis]|uniref:Uncharacterized protein n=1 Tax=Leptospira mtsangambouensis TaxID=2484912 RepID=A0ABY2P007_9LEPT|nr:hypothetical protein [Leptospira mtsangambouensis]TGM74404.1 hypothetical protein EHR01_10615 [Leptospira mtsangambouensis]